MATAYEKEIVEANKKYASTYKHGGLELKPKKKAVVITCMDCRLNPAEAYGLDYGDTITLRNGGAMPEDAYRSAVISCIVLGAEEVFLVKHTRCGLLNAPPDNVIHQVMKQRLGVTESKEVDEFVPMSFDDPEQSARAGVEWLRNAPLLPKDVRVTGWVHDTDTGLVKKVVE